MARRPANLNLGRDRPEAFEPPKMFGGQNNLPSPRAGEIPPALSPLDAFAMHSRLLAKKFEEEAQNGRRMSRLPPTMVAKEMKNRPGYFRSLSNESKMTDVDEASEESSPVSSRGRVEDGSNTDNFGKERPMSHYPTLDNTGADEEVPALPTPYYDAIENPEATATAKDGPDYFGMPRAASPEPVDGKMINVQAPSPNAFPSLTSSIDTISTHPRTMTNGSQRSQRSLTSDRGLAPPQSPRYPKSPRSFQSIRSVPPDSGDEDGQSTSGSHALSSSRKFSGSSGVSRPQSPFSPWMQPIHRSPSMTSEYSINGSQQLQRPAPNFSNFSRPMSSSGSRPSFDTRPSLDARPSLDTRPSMDSRPSFERHDMPHRHPSGASSSTTHSSKPPLSRQGSDDDAPHSGPPDTPMYPPDTPGGNSSSSYIYAKYALPRGRPVDRDSRAFRDSWIQKQFDWDREHDQHPNRPQHAHHERVHSDFEAKARASPTPSDAGRSGRSLTPGASEIRSRSADPRGLQKAAAFHRSSPSVKTDSTDRTIRALPLHKKSPSADLSPEEHLDIGISCHNSGETNKSTYHLRLAAIAGLPTAMLLYALACRHGWGMRPNQEEGVKWLRKAIETSGLDVADAEDKLNATSGHANLDPAERKKRKAQYALAIYELGISSMNGWGCAKDKPLAVRCYEIAGSWGDADALAEAGFCYTEGVGVKKDLKKAASLYRKAAESGMSMAGNSW